MGSRRKYSEEFKREAVQLASQADVRVVRLARALRFQPKLLIHMNYNKKARIRTEIKFRWTKTGNRLSGEMIPRNPLKARPLIDG